LVLALLLMLWLLLLPFPKRRDAIFQRSEMSKRRRSSLVDAFLGAFLGAVIACMVKGAQLGWDDGRGDWAWLNALFGFVGGPFLLILDCLTSLGKGPSGSELQALPWAGIGAAIGAVAGLLGDVPADRRE